MNTHHIVWIYCLQLTFGQPHLLWQYGYNDKEQRKDDNDDTIWENLIKYVQASDSPQCSKYSNVCQDQIEKVETIWKSDYHIKHQIRLWENTVMMKCHFVHFTLLCHNTMYTHFDGGVSFTPFILAALDPVYPFHINQISLWDCDIFPRFCREKLRCPWWWW